jgi:hypothetical protein
MSDDYDEGSLSESGVESAGEDELMGEVEENLEQKVTSNTLTSSKQNLFLT